MFRKYIKFILLILFFMIFIRISIQQGIYAVEFNVIKYAGDVWLKAEGKPYARIKKNDNIKTGDSVKTGRDSEIIFKNKEDYFKLHAYGRIKIEKVPSLVYGKLSRSSVYQFLDLHFYFTPLPAQGKTIKVIVRSKESKLNISSSIYNENGYKNELFFYALSSHTYRALAGFDVEAQPVKYYLTIKAYNENGCFTEIIHPFYLKKMLYKSGKVFLTDEKKDLLKPSKQKDEERKKLSQILSRASGKALWEDTFIFPVNSPDIVSEFGKKRMYYVNNVFSFTSFHRGTDLKGISGDPVFSPNNGVVVFSEERITTGNTVAIDHGQGVFSLFFHLESMDVQTGVIVKKGEKIGCIGSTGITEGAHLHWGLFVSGIYVDPSDWIKRVF